MLALRSHTIAPILWMTKNHGKSFNNHAKCMKNGKGDDDANKVVRFYQVKTLLRHSVCATPFWELHIYQDKHERDKCKWQNRTQKWHIDILFAAAVRSTFCYIITCQYIEIIITQWNALTHQPYPFGYFFHSLE